MLTDSETMTQASAPPDDLAEGLSGAVIVITADGLRVRYLNAAAEDLLGASRRRLEGAALDELLTDADDWIGRVRRAARDGEAFTAREVTLPSLRGEPVRRVDLHVTPWRDPAGHALIILELTPVDRALRIAREAALHAQEQANRLLLRGLAHEIRNPLAGLRGAAQLLEREVADPALREYTDVIVRETDRLRSLVERMVGPARPLASETLNIHEITEHVLALLRAEAPTGVILRTDYDPSLPPLQGDRDRLVQALLNLGRNALQAVGAQGCVCIRTSSRQRFTIGSRVHRLVACIEIVDDGPGIPPELADTLFQPMVSGRPEGSGLGLTIALSLIGQHDGLIESESEPGHTVFRAFLPLERDHA